MKNLKGFKIMGLLGISLCTLCCAVPFIGVMAGIGALMALSKYIEWAGLVALVTAAVFLVLYILNKRKAPSCDIDCNCKPEKELRYKDK
jgi:hypothetical protein